MTDMTIRQRRFVLGISEGLNQTDAAREAGYSCPAVAGSRLMSSSNVREAIRDTLVVHGLDDDFLAACVRDLCLASKEGRHGKPVPDWIGRSRGLDILCRLRGAYMVSSADTTISFEEILTQVETAEAEDKNLQEMTFLEG